ncbi:hypothetical protein HK101_005337 [Irineochytrium annulatum]|nr:hypothetical protein HK101_005337 [Irineochytrium annulatum]
MAIDDIKTLKEIFEEFRLQSFRVKYVRIPISAEQAPEDQYLDEMMAEGSETVALSSSMQLDIYNIELSHNRAILRLVYVLEKGLSSKMSPHSAIDWALARGALIDDLKNAVLGNYQYILQLASVLHDGSECKRLLDEAINSCDAMVNLREVILLNRVQFSNTGDPTSLEKAVGCLERYFFLLAFCSYINESVGSGVNTDVFSEWLRARAEIWRTLESFRRKGPKLNLFRPVEDLSVFSEEGPRVSGIHHTSNVPIKNELEKFIIKQRQGSVLVHHTILKIDQWSKESSRGDNIIDGAPNFRKIDGFPIYGVAQPTIQGMKSVVKCLTTEDERLPNFSTPKCKKVCWINLREEPICYINGQPHVLRDENITLRNIKSYSGISPSRLEQIESRLKEDVIGELKTFDNRVLLHGESADKLTLPMWEDCQAENVLTVRDVIEVLRQDGLVIDFHRVPVTAEQAPDDSDFDALVQILTHLDLSSTAIVLNCQVGVGRSTTGTIICSLVLDWIKGTLIKDTDVQPAKKPLNYQIIHSLLRVIRNGMECRRSVDHAIDQCAFNTNIRDAIEDYRLSAESETDDQLKKRFIRKGILSLKRYFALIAFVAYLDDNPPQSMNMVGSFRSWMNGRKEFATMIEDLENSDLKALIPVEQSSPGDGIALSTEVLDVVNKRNGSVLAKQTILKADVFPGAQKLSLPDRIEGAPNFRRIPFINVLAAVVPAGATHYKMPPEEDKSVYGIGMPTKDAIRTAISRVGAGPNGVRRLLWTSLREEPVLYIRGKPYVLRLFQDPMKNLEATGIARERVELMEAQMKADCIAELQKYSGRLLVHEEEQTKTGFSIVPIWETVSIDEIETPLEVYTSVVTEGYQVDYKRIPITDEQAPIPDVFDQFVDRLSNMDSDQPVDVMFNCQMGRGRTTTGILIGVLENGRLAKRLTDKAIDLCEHMQNLRSAIYDYKLRVEALEVGSKKVSK